MALYFHFLKFVIMGFSSGSMNIVIKNNRALLKKHRKSLKEVSKLGSYARKKKVEYNLPKRCPKSIELLGKRIKAENKALFIKQMIVFGVVICLLFYIALTL